MSGVTNDLIKKSNKISKDFSPSEYDVLVSSGEQISCALISGRLNHIGIKSRSWLSWQVPIFTEGNHKKSRISNIFKSRILKYLNSGGVPVITGFQGINLKTDLPHLKGAGQMPVQSWWRNILKLKNVLSILMLRVFILLTQIL